MTKESAQEQEERLATLHAEIQTLQGSLAQARAEREKVVRDSTRRGRDEGAEQTLRSEISRLAEALLADTVKREAAE